MIVPGPHPTSSSRSPAAQVREEVAGRVLRRPPAVAAQHRFVVSVGVDVVVVIAACHRRTASGPVSPAGGLRVTAMDRPIGERPYMPDYGVDTRRLAAAALGVGRRAAGDRPQLLGRHRLGGGRPHAMPVWGVWDDDELRFAFSCGPRVAQGRQPRRQPAGRRRLRRTPSSACRWRAARMLVDGERRDSWIARYLAKYTAVSHGAERRLPAPEPRVRGRAGARAGDHRARGRVRHASHPLALRPRPIERRRPVSTEATARRSAAHRWYR